MITEAELIEIRDRFRKLEDIAEFAGAFLPTPEFDEDAEFTKAGMSEALESTSAHIDRLMEEIRKAQV